MDKIELTINGVAYDCTPKPPPVSSTGLLLVPFDAKATIFELDKLPWVGEHDTGTDIKGKKTTSTGDTTYPLTMGGRQTRLFTNTFTDNGGHRYHVKYDIDPTSKNFVYAGDLYVETVQPIGQMELDNNQVDNDGFTYIFGVQQNANDKVWDVTSTNQVTTSCVWHPTSAKADPTTWPLKTWLHFEIACHRDDLGNIYYDAIHFNGLTEQIQKVYASSLKIGWSVGACLTNFQIGGKGATGSIKIYASNLKVAKW